MRGHLRNVFLMVIANLIMFTQNAKRRYGNMGKALISAIVISILLAVPAWAGEDEPKRTPKTEIVYEICPSCHGSRQVLIRAAMPMFVGKMIMLMPAQYGPCSYCGGSGQIKKEVQK
jgi:hypothetical protein